MTFYTKTVSFKQDFFKKSFFILCGLENFFENF